MAAAEPDNFNKPIDWDFKEDDEMDLKECGMREMNMEELEEYYRAVSASQGFDVPDFPGTMAFGRIEPIPDAKEESYAEELFSFATLAIEDYNNRSGLKYEVVEIIKANNLGVQGIIYYITFNVKPVNTPAHFPTTIFQAKVYDGIRPNDVQIKICRPKPCEGANPAENDGGYCC